MGRKLVVAVDDSAVSRDTLHWAAQKLLQPDDELHIISVLEPAGSASFASTSESIYPVTVSDVSGRGRTGSGFRGQGCLGWRSRRARNRAQPAGKPCPQALQSHVSVNAVQAGSAGAGSRPEVSGQVQDRGRGQWGACLGVARRRLMCPMARPASVVACSLPVRTGPHGHGHSPLHVCRSLAGWQEHSLLCLAIMPRPMSEPGTNTHNPPPLPPHHRSSR